MASEYLKWKYRDVRPEASAELTPAEKRKNWWHYHKWHVLLAAVLLAAGVNILLHVLGVGRVEPDYQIAYVAAAPLPESAVEALETALAELGGDANGDGRAVAQVNQYAGGGSSGDAEGYYALAASTKLMADLTDRESYFFLLDDPGSFQRGYHALRRLDGSLPPDTDANWEACCLRWTDCPALTALELGEYGETALNHEISGANQDLFAGLYVARRGFWTEETCAQAEACDALWEAMTKGART